MFKILENYSEKNFHSKGKILIPHLHASNLFRFHPNVIIKILFIHKDKISTSNEFCMMIISNTHFPQWALKIISTQLIRNNFFDGWNIKLKIEPTI